MDRNQDCKHVNSWAGVAASSVSKNGSKLISGRLARWMRSLCKLKCELCDHVVYVSSDEFLNEMKHRHQVNWWHSYMALHLRHFHPDVWSQFTLEEPFQDVGWNDDADVVTVHDEAVVDHAQLSSRKNVMRKKFSSRNLPQTVTLEEFLLGKRKNEHDK